MQNRPSIQQKDGLDFFSAMSTKAKVYSAVVLFGLLIIGYLSYGAWINWQASHCVGTSAVSHSENTTNTSFDNKYYSFSYTSTPDLSWHQVSGDPVYGSGYNCGLVSQSPYWLFRPAAAYLMPSWLQMFLLHIFPSPDDYNFARISVSMKGNNIASLDGLQKQVQKNAEFNTRTLSAPDKPQYTFSRGSISGVDALIYDYKIDSDHNGNSIHSTSRIYELLKNGTEYDVEWSVFGKTAQDRDSMLTKYQPQFEKIVESVKLK